MELSWTHVHLLFNHFPIVGAIGGLLLLIYALFKDSEDLKQAASLVFFLIALISILVFYGGVQAEEVVEQLPRVPHSLIHAHRKVAEQALIALEILGVMSLFWLLLFRGAKRTPTWFTPLLLVIAVVATVFVSWAGLQGGIIRHTEVRGEFSFLLPKDAAEAGGHEHGGAETKHEQSGQSGHEHSQESGHSHE
ncbi:MAG: hypothetical protein AB1861_21440 [Cyanobacteriota bacterium]